MKTLFKLRAIYVIDRSGKEKTFQGNPDELSKGPDARGEFKDSELHLRDMKEISFVYELKVKAMESGEKPDEWDAVNISNGKNKDQYPIRFICDNKKQFIEILEQKFGNKLKLDLLDIQHKDLEKL